MALAFFFAGLLILALALVAMGIVLSDMNDRDAGDTGDAGGDT